MGLSLPLLMLPIVYRLIVYTTLRFLSMSNKSSTSKLQEKFGEQVKKMRMARNISQEELAFRAHIHRTYLSGIETGRRNPSLRNIASIAKALDISMAELFRFK